MKEEDKPTIELDFKEKTSIITNSTAQEIENEFEEHEKKSEELVEASLFVAGKFMDLNELTMLTGLNHLLLSKILNNLKRKYSNGAIRVISINNSWKMDVSKEYNYLINKLATGNVEFTKAEQETLAIIAYKQPVKQSVVINIRGNKSYDHIKKFRELGLVNAKPYGRTLILELSNEFYEYFSLHNKKNN
ncbi:MAG: SMC-Scp complex subunit ScpB [Candidatus Pacearchaeota archaeon]